MAPGGQGEPGTNGKLGLAPTRSASPVQGTEGNSWGAHNRRIKE
jgi:hypothetical protein